MSKQTCKHVYESDNGDVSVTVEDGNKSVLIKTNSIDNKGVSNVLKIDSETFVNILKSMEGVLINRLTREQLIIMKTADDISALLRDNKEIVGFISNGELKDVVSYEDNSGSQVSISEVSLLFNVVQALATYYLINDAGNTYVNNNQDNNV